MQSPLAAADFDKDQSAESHVDYEKLACLLCKRQFQSKTVLDKHVAMSNLHKQNLAKIAAASTGRRPIMPVGPELQAYRDRAKERRQKYGAPAPPEPVFKAEDSQPAPIVPEQPSQSGVGSDNIGSKLMQKMGWNTGRGLGRDESGIVDPIQAHRRVEQAGLGAAGARYADLQTEGTSYSDNVKKVMQARFNEMR